MGFPVAFGITDRELVVGAINAGPFVCVAVL